VSSIDAVIKAEITRLAKREARKLTEPLREEIKKLKKHDVERRRQLTVLATRLQQQQARARLTEQTAQVATGEVKGRLSPKLIRSLRKKLGISQGAFAGLVGVSSITIGNWEKGKSAPRPELKTKVLSLRGMGRREAKLLVAETAAKLSVPAPKNKAGRNCKG